MIPTRATQPNQFTMVRNGNSNEPQVTLTLNREDLVLIQRALLYVPYQNGKDEEVGTTLLAAVDDLAYSAYQLDPSGTPSALAAAINAGLPWAG